MACSVLHNRAIRAGLPDPELLPEDEVENDFHQEDVNDINIARSGNELRNHIADRLARF